MIALAIVIPLMVVVPMRLTRTVMYSASSQVQAQSASPDAVTQAAAILDRVAAVATSPTVVTKALQAAGLKTPPGWVASKAIAVTSLGGSAVAQLTVTDRNPVFAKQLAGALAGAVATELNELGTQQSAAALAALDQQTQALTAHRDALLAQLNATNASTSGAPALSAGVEGLLAELSAVNGQLTQVMSAQQSLLTSSSANSSAGVIALPKKATAQSSGVVTDAVLACLLGLVLGLLISTLHEVAKPSISDAATAGRELGVPVLGSLEVVDGGLECADLAILTRIALAARRAEVGTLVVAGSPDADKLTSLSATLTRQMEALALTSGAAPSPDQLFQTAPITGRAQRKSGDPLPYVKGSAERILAVTTLLQNTVERELKGVPVGLRAVSFGDLSPASRLLSPAILMITTEFAPHEDLERITELSQTTGWPVLGVIGLPTRRPLDVRRDHRSSKRSEKSERKSDKREKRQESTSTEDLAVAARAVVTYGEGWGGWERVSSGDLTIHTSTQTPEELK